MREANRPVLMSKRTEESIDSVHHTCSSSLFSLSFAPLSLAQQNLVGHQLIISVFSDHVGVEEALQLGHKEHRKLENVINRVSHRAAHKPQHEHII